MTNTQTIEISSHAIIDTLNNAGVVKIGEANYLMFVFMPEREGTNPITGAKMLIPERTELECFNTLSLHFLSEEIVEKQITLYPVDLPEITQFPCTLVTSDGELIGVFNKTILVERRTKEVTRPEQVIDDISVSKEFMKKVRSEVMSSIEVITTGFPFDFDSEKQVVDLIVHKNIHR